MYTEAYIYAYIAHVWLLLNNLSPFLYLDKAFISQYAHPIAEPSHPLYFGADSVARIARTPVLK